MGVKNAYIAQRDADRKYFFVAGCETAEQQMFDMMCLVLHDPEVMGKGHTIGAERLKRIHEALYKYENMFHEAWAFTQESDYYQEKLDDALREIFGIIEPFNKRYPYQKEWNYKKPCKK